MTFGEIALPMLFAAFVWWFSTGAILWLDRLPRKTFVWTFSAASLIGAAALFGLAATAADASANGAYLAFTCAIAIWGWHEMSFLMGFILGPRREPCPIDARGWQRFKLATATVIHHEVALALTALAVVALTWGQPNQVGTLTFAVLWVMRLSAKFNLFLGARHRGENLLPPHLQHLKSYFRQRSMNALFPVSLAGGAALAWTLASLAHAPAASPYEEVGFSLLLAMTLLALVEHVFMFVPPPNTLLWGWAEPRQPQQLAVANAPVRQITASTPKTPSSEIIHDL
ncbi:MAG: putative photosynthetic complex assembly protein PuhE [Hyphomonadaceae bacterium]|nr:putative photosynthetic complex assembly protein PuhE [Hyphomonadaceae bacterium]